MSTVLITGASRGLGLEYARQYAAAKWRVHACCRDPDSADALNDLAARSAGAVTVHRLDVVDHGRIDALAEALGDEPVDVLLNNAGIYGGGHKEFGKIDYPRWEETLRVNSLAPLRMVEAFVEHVARSGRKLVVCMSSRMGSMAANTGGGSYVYRSSKAALNAVARSLAADLGNRGITVVVLSPGWVATDMGGAGAPLGPEESVRGMRSLIDRFSPADSGRFFGHDGAEIPW